MAIITGSGASETLLGTSANDTLVSNGGVDTMIGYDGSDTYEIYQSYPSTPVSGYHAIIDDQGTDGAVDVITGGRALYEPVSNGYSGWTTAERVGNDMVIVLPGRPAQFHNPGYASYTIEITGQFAGNSVEQIMIGATLFNLATSDLGTPANDFMAGTAGRDVLYGYEGQDYIVTNGGADKVDAGAGNDTVFGGEGRNALKLGAGDDLAVGGSGVDKVRAGGGNDSVDGLDGNNKVSAGAGDDSVSTGAGDDLIKGDGGNDILTAGDGNNTVIGGSGDDSMSTGTGNDVLSGGTGGDVYTIAMAAGAIDTITDNGNAAINGQGPFDRNIDEVRLTGYASTDAGAHGLNVSVSGNDLVLTYDLPAAAGSGQVIIQNHLLGARYALEQVSFGLAGVGYEFHIASLQGDQWSYSASGGPDVGVNDIVLGTAGNDQIVSGIGYDIVLGGGGADVFLFENNGPSAGGLDIILDFNPADDVLDFSQIGTLAAVAPTITDSAYGNALITSVYGTVELVGLTAADINLTDPMFLFA